MSHVIAISNVKGGVAKTTTCSTLGRAFSQKGYRVLLVDLDAQADLTWSVGIKPSTVAYGSKDLFAPGLVEKIGIQPFLIPTVYENLTLLPAKSDIDWGSEERATSEGRNKILKNIYETYLTDSFDFILMDCAPAINLYILNALTASQLVIIPTQAEYFSANSLLKMMRILRQVRQNGNPQLDYRVLVTLLDLRARIQRNALEEFRKGFGENLFSTNIEIDTKIRESQSAHIPVIDYKPNSRGSIQYQNLSLEVLNNFNTGANSLQPSQTQVGREIGPPEDATQSFCPFLGIKHDIKTVVNYASTMNYCHYPSKSEVPKLVHQSTHCLSQSYQACPLLKANKKIPFPEDLREYPPSLWNKLGF